MSKTQRLTDLQRILLSAASAREDGSVHPIAASIAGRTEDVEKALTSLTRRALVAGDPPIITEAGKALIDGGENEAPALAPAVTPASAPSPHINKTDAVIALLQREGGATLAELIAATGWLPHTTRAAMTGLRKKGHAILRGTRDGVTIWSIAAEA